MSVKPRVLWRLVYLVPEPAPVSAMVMVLWLDPFYALMCVFIAHIIRVCGWVAPTCYLSVHPRGLMPESSRVTGGRRALIGNGG